MLGYVFSIYGLVLATSLVSTTNGIIQNELQAARQWHRIQDHLQNVDPWQQSREVIDSLPSLFTNLWQHKSAFNDINQLVQAIHWQYGQLVGNQTQTSTSPVLTSQKMTSTGPIVSSTVKRTPAPMSTVQPCGIQCQIQKILSQLDISVDCAVDTGSFLYAFYQIFADPKTAAQNTWVLMAVDSMAKFPQPGILIGNNVFEGQRWECENITNSNPNFGMKYAFASIKTSGDSKAECPATVTDIFASNPQVMKFAVCIPKSCSNRDASKILGFVLQSRSCGVLTVESQVQHYSSGNIAMITFTSIVGLLMVFATILDYGVHQRMLGKLEGDAVKEYIANTNLFVKILLAFSVYTNGKIILNTAQKPGQIYCVHGIRLFSMMWVVVGHSYMQIFSADNIYLLYLWFPKQIYNLTITNATFSVDSFFLMSGLLLSYLWFKEMQRNPWRVKSVPTWIMYYVHRYLRLTPVYAIVIVCYLYLMPLLSNGYIDELNDFKYCRDGWWKNILYVTNVVQPGKMCFGVAWYLANDMQFYVLAPIILIPLFIHPIAGIVVGLVLTGASLAVNLWTTWYYHFATDLVFGLAPVDPIYIERVIKDGWFAAGEDPHWSLNYVAPWIRFVPYLIGVFLGYVMARKKTFKMSRLLSLAIWLVATGTALAIVYGLLYNSQGHQLPLGVRMLYNAVSRPLWSCCLSWLIFACHYGYAGWINEFLSWKGFIPLSRLTYCAYLLHIMLVQILNASWNRTPHWNGHFNWLFTQAVPLLAFTYVVSFLFSCAFELPTMTLERLMLPDRRATPTRQNALPTHQLANANAVSPMENGQIPAKHD